MADGRRVVVLTAVSSFTVGALVSAGLLWAQEKRRRAKDSSSSYKSAGGVAPPVKPNVTKRRTSHRSSLSQSVALDSEMMAPLTEVIQSSIGEKRRAPLVVGVAGGTGSGKTTFANALFQTLGEEHVTFITHDSYYKDLSHLPHGQRALQNFDHPDSLDTALLCEHLGKLCRGETVEIPLYDFTTHTRISETILAEPRQVILVEGILIFSDVQLAKMLNIKVFVDTEADIRLIRRIHRDVRQRGRGLESIVDQYIATVRPMHLEFVEPSKRVADVIVPMGANAVALDMFLSRLQSEIERRPSFIEKNGKVGDAPA